MKNSTQINTCSRVISETLNDLHQQGYTFEEVAKGLAIVLASQQLSDVGVIFELIIEAKISKTRFVLEEMQKASGWQIKVENHD